MKQTGLHLLRRRWFFLSLDFRFAGFVHVLNYLFWNHEHLEHMYGTTRGMIFYVLYANRLLFMVHLAKKES